MVLPVLCKSSHPDSRTSDVLLPLESLTACSTPSPDATDCESSIIAHTFSERDVRTLCILQNDDNIMLEMLRSRCTLAQSLPA